MLNIPNAFLPLTNLPLLDMSYVDEAKTVNYITPEVEKRDGYMVTQNFYSGSCSFNQSTFMKKLNQRFGSTRADYLKFTPCSYYHWHADILRNCAINVLIEEVPDSVTIFKEQITRLSFNTMVCDYVPRQFVLFNTSVPHCVINSNKTKTRHILTITLPKAVTFEELKDYFATTSDFDEGI